MKYIYLAAACLMLASWARAQQTTDGQLFSEGRIALDQHKDCARAKRAFESESKAAQESPVWLDYAARASECVGDLDSALRYYELELSQMPSTGRLINKVGELKYQIQVRRDKVEQQALHQNALIASKPLLEQIAVKLTSLGTRTVDSKPHEKITTTFVYKNATTKGCYLTLETEETDLYKHKFWRSNSDTAEIDFSKAQISTDRDSEVANRTIYIHNVRTTSIFRSERDSNIGFPTNFSLRWLPSDEFTVDVLDLLNRVSDMCRGS